MTKSSIIDFATKSSITLTNWMSADDPRKKIYKLGYGLNMKGCCKNPSCISVSYNLQNEMWVQKGYGIFSMAIIKNKNLCHGCQNQMDPASFGSFGYVNAKLTIKGSKKGNDGVSLVSTTDQNHFQDKFIMFGIKQQQSSEWQSLYITVKKE